MEIFGISMEEWQVWVLLGIVMFIVEIFTPAFVAACLGIGFVFGGLASGLNMGYSMQLVFFSVGTAGSFFLIRPFILKVGYKGSEKVKTNADSLIGRVARVTENIDPAKGTGYVAVDGDHWKAVSATNEAIETGSQVTITQRDSIVVTVVKNN